MTIDIETFGTTAVVKLSTPDGLNLLTSQLRSELEEGLTALDHDSGVRAIVLQGTERAFSSGADINELPLPPCDPRGLLKRILSVIRLPERLGKPVIAVVEGNALAGGFELALACDWIFASPDARFSLPEVAVGLVPGYALSRLPMLVGEAKARRMMLDPVLMGPEEVAAMGIHVTPCEDPAAAAMAMAERMAAAAPNSAALVKRLTNRWLRMSDFTLVIEAYGFLFNTQDAAEGIQAFREHREPQFLGK